MREANKIASQPVFKSFKTVVLKTVGRGRVEDDKLLIVCFEKCHELVASTYFPDWRDNVIHDKHRAIATKSHFQRYRQYHVRLFSFGCLILFYGICRCETNTCACLPHHAKSLLGN